MRVIIAGSRNLFPTSKQVEEAVWGSGFPLTQLVSGGAAGVDTAGEKWALEVGRPIRIYRANWGEQGKAAGPIRNRAMAEYADALILIWDGKSRGSSSMLREMQRQGKPIFQVIMQGCPIGAPHPSSGP